MSRYVTNMTLSWSRCLDMSQSAPAFQLWESMTGLVRAQTDVTPPQVLGMGRGAVRREVGG